MDEIASDSTHESDDTPRGAITLPIREDTLVPHVRSHALRLKKLEDSASKVVHQVDVIVARAMVNIKEQVMLQLQSELGPVKTSLAGQDVILLQIKGAAKLLALVAAVAAFLGAISEIISLATHH